MAAGQAVKLFKGKQAPDPNASYLWFDKYIDDKVIDLSGPPPAKGGHGDKMPGPRLMLANGPDPSVRKGFIGCGCCVYAGYTNKKRLAWSIAGKGLFPGDGPTVVTNYSAGTGYDINQTDADGNNPTDQGTNMRTMLGQMVKPATAYLGSDGQRHGIQGFVAINFTNWNHYLWAVYLDDTGVLTGVNFPASGMTQFNSDKPWTPVPHDSPEGGHCILVDWRFKAESWARDQDIDPAGAWLKKWMDEAYLTLDADGLVGGKTIEGFDSQQLASDAAAAGKR